MTLGRYNLACRNFGRGQITSRSPMDLNVILYVTPEWIRQVNQRRLRDNLCISVKREDSQCNALRMTEKNPLRVESM